MSTDFKFWFLIVLSAIYGASLLPKWLSWVFCSVTYAAAVLVWCGVMS
ncbi:hypothetical protein DFP87_1255 [Achromobacter marplatensis]|uniref:Uncharacterized protein n=1 Tax=Achromobacter marplatensis TaxID=470868 RepID=A0ABX9FV03_9BURK|nr:hypothetical protein DFP87_1255 [Achromobacter marplatensis]CAB3712839.1 hypothetical protein LMG26219_06026 [Achromobacter marplatensis]